MKRLGLFLLGCICLCASADEPRFEGDPAAARAVWSTFQRWQGAYEKADLDGAMAIFDPGVVFIFQGGPDQGYEDLRKGYVQDFRSRAPGSSWVALVDEVYSDGKLAFMRATWELHVKDKDGATRVAERNRSVDILRLDDGKWHIIRSFNFPEKRP